MDLTTRVLEGSGLSIPIFDGSHNNGKGKYLSEPEIIKNSLLEQMFEAGDLQSLLLVKIDSKNPDANHLRQRTFSDGIRRKLAFSSGNSYYFADDSLHKKIRRLFATEPDTACRYGSLLVSNCYKGSETFTGLRVKIVDFEDPQYAHYKTGDCHGKISPQLAKQLGGEGNCPFQFRFAWRSNWAEPDNSECPKTSFLSKGTFLPDATLTDAKGYDIIMDRSSIKGIKKSELKNLIPCGDYEFPQAVIGNRGNAKATSYDNSWQFTIWYSEEAVKQDLSKPTEEKAKELAELQRNPLVLAKYIIQQYDKQQRSPTAGVPPSQQEQSEEAFNEIEGNANNQAQESRWISLLRSDKYGQLIETPKFRKFATDYIANQWRDLAIKGGYNHNSGMAMPCDRLTRGTICVPHLPEGDVILTRYPIVNSDNIRLYQNIHDPELRKTRNVVWIHPKDAEEYHQADFDGDQLMVSSASKLPNIVQETLRAGEPGRFEPVKQRPKLAYTEITDEEDNLKYKNLAEIAAASSQNKVGLVATNIGRVQSSMPQDGENVERFGRRQRKLLNRLFQALQVEVDSPKSAERLEDIKEIGLKEKPANQKCKFNSTEKRKMNNTKSHISQLKLLSSRKFSTNLRNLKINRTDLLFILLCLAIGIYLLATKPIFVTILGCATIVFLSIGYVIRTVPILEKYLGRKIRFWHIVAAIITVTALLDTFTTPAQAIFLSGLESFFNNLAQQSSQAGGGSTSTLDTNVENEVSEFAHSIEEGLKELPPGEKITFCTGCYSDDTESYPLQTGSTKGVPHKRQTPLTAKADDCQLKPVSVLLRNEQLRVEQLKEAGSRQIWNQIAFCTWTSDDEAGSQHKDFVGGLIEKCRKFGSWAVEQITGNKRIYQEEFFKKLLLQGFQQGFIQWELLLNTKIGLEVTPCSATDLWEWLWNRFNEGAAPPIPQVITLKETETGLELTETLTTDKHICTLLIEGQQGRSACPEHRGDNDRVYLTGKSKVCGVMVVADPPVGWSNAQDQLKWVWKILASSYVHDTEAWIEISRSNDFFIQDNLARQAKQSKTARTLAITKGQGRDVGAEIKQEESFEAQRRLYEGTKALHCAPVFLVYRHSAQELTHACNLLANSFETAKVIRERNIAWEIWLQTLPITCKWLLHGGNLSERRITLDTHTVAGIMPLTVPKDIDKQGVEFLTSRGGKPIYVDLFHQQIGRALITGTSGSGKSVLGWRFALEALANNIPVVGMDISASGNSTFKTAIELLGEQGAYYDISSGSSNLLEPPDLRRFDKPERERRMESWKDFIRKALTAIAMGKVENPHLAQRVDALLVKALDVFLKDPEIITRYNRAFEMGWLSPEWQQIPTLPDFVKFCTRERLNLRSFEEIDRQALNQIQNQVSALLASRLGKAIARPSTFSPLPAIKFFALSGLSNEQDAYLMAINAHSACIRNALSHPKSLFIGDELSVLLRKDGFAQIIGETCATGRKEGIAVLLLSQDPDTICECSTGAQIMQNMTYRITGRITSSGIASFQQYLGYPVNIISQNATEAFLPRTSDLYSCWLVETGGRFWRTRFYPGEMMLASVANNQDEREARERVMAQYPDTAKGNLLGLRAFTDAYIPALKENRGFKHIGKEIDQTPVLRDWLYPAVSPADRPHQSGASLQGESDRQENNDDQQAESSLIAS